MDEQDEICFEDGDFEVVDECMEDEILSVEDEITELKDESSTQIKQECVNRPETLSNTMDNSEPEIIEEVNPPIFVTNPLSKKKPIGLTLDQISDQELMKNLDELERIVFDIHPMNSSSKETTDLPFIPLSQDSPVTVNVNETQENTETDVIVLEDELEAQNVSQTQEIDHPWYTEKIEAKQTIVKERFSKLARVLQFSYPSYQNWLDRTKKKIGSPVCKLEPPRRCLLSELHVNRWKFVCTQKPVVDPAEVMEGQIVNKKIKTVWQLDPCAATGVNANKTVEKIPDYVIRAVKVFEEFINGLQELKNSNEMNNEKTVDLAEKTSKSAGPCELWLWLLVRCNSKKELMIFATGRNIEDSTIDGLKTLFESGRGKDCNVKSLYCKSLAKTDNVQTSRTIFLVGSEALDENIGSLKIQLAPKTNFWLSTSGAAELAKTVEQFLVPNDITTVLDIGCGLGLLGLTMAKKCKQVIGMDTPSEVEEAEMTCELNNIKNAYFIMGEPFEVMTTISNSVAGCRTAAIVNGNSNVGRTVEIMTGLRKIPTLRRVVMVTTMTKQSVRSILELTKPGDDILGDPFMPVRAVVVDTLPTGPQFEVVIRMDRKPMANLPNISHAESVKKTLPSKKDIAISNIGTRKSPRKISNEPPNRKFSPIRKDLSEEKRAKKICSEEPQCGTEKKLVKNPFHDRNTKSPGQGQKRRRSRSRSQSPSTSKFSRTSERNDNDWNVNDQNISNQTASNQNVSSLNDTNNEAAPVPIETPINPPTEKLEWDYDIVERPYVPYVPTGKKARKRNKKIRHPNQQKESNLIEKMKEQQKILEEAKKTLTNSDVVDKNLARQIGNMIDTVVEQTNEIQNQLPRSIWDLITPPDPKKYTRIFPTPRIYPNFKGGRRSPHSLNDFSICHSAVMVEPNLIMPINEYRAIPNPNLPKNSQKPQEDSWDDDINNWESLTTCRSNSRSYNDATPNKREPSPPRRSSPPQRYFSAPRHSPPRQPVAPSKYINSPRRDAMSRPPVMSQNRSPRRDRAPPPSQRPLSPKRASPPGFNDDWDIPSRGAIEQNKNWKKSGNDLQPWNFNSQVNNFRKNNVEESWDHPTSNENWNNSSSGSVNASTTLQKDQWQMMGAFDGRYSGWDDDKRNIRGKEIVINPRSKELRNENNIQRWNPPQNKNWKPEKEDWNDLPEDARDPWGDDGTTGTKDRWKFDNNQQEGWKRDSEPMDWSRPKNNWKNKGPISMNSNTSTSQWLNPIKFSKDTDGVSNKTSNLNIPRWNITNDVPNKSQSSGNWQQNSNNSSWKPSNFNSGFQLPRYYNLNNFNDGR